MTVAYIETLSDDLPANHQDAVTSPLRLKMALLRSLMDGLKVCSASSCAFDSAAAFIT